MNAVIVHENEDKFSSYSGLGCNSLLQSVGSLIKARRGYLDCSWALSSDQSPGSAPDGEVPCLQAVIQLSRTVR